LSEVCFPAVKDAEGKLEYPALKLKKGDNDVDEDHFEAVLDRANPAWREAMLKDYLEVDGYEPADADDEGDDDPPMTAADAIEAAKSAETVEALEALEDGETRKTVLAAIEKRAEELEQVE
jgi:hypothetical protein